MTSDLNGKVSKRAPFFSSAEVGALTMAEVGALTMAEVGALKHRLKGNFGLWEYLNLRANSQHIQNKSPLVIKVTAY